MSQDELLKKVKTLGEFDDADEVLFAYLDSAKDAILMRRYPFGGTPAGDLPEGYQTLQCEIAVFLLNKRGAEGQISHDENGIDRSYENGYIPESLLGRVTPFVGVIG